MAKVLKKEIKNNYTWYKYTVIWHTVYLTGPVYEEEFAKETKKEVFSRLGSLRIEQRFNKPAIGDISK